MTRDPTEMERNVMVALWHCRNKWRKREGYGPPGDAEKQELWEDARAAIRAMREPTDEMLTCGYAAGYAADDGVDEVTEVLAEIVYTAMIRAASPEEK